MAEAKLTDIVGIGPAKAQQLRGFGIVVVSQVASADAVTIAKVRGLSKATAAVVIENARCLGKDEPQRPLVRRSKKQVAQQARRKELTAEIKSLEKKLAKLKKQRKATAAKIKKAKAARKKLASQSA